MAIRLHSPTATWTLPIGDSVIGRGRDCAVRIGDPRLSRHHARIAVTVGAAVVHDLGSTNGVLVNGDRVKGSAELRHGDVIVCGPCVIHVTTDERQPPKVVVTGEGSGFGSGLSRTDAMDPVDDAPVDHAPAGSDPAAPADHPTPRPDSERYSGLQPARQERTPTSALSAHAALGRIDPAIAATVAASGLMPHAKTSSTSALDARNVPLSAHRADDHPPGDRRQDDDPGVDGRQRTTQHTPRDFDPRATAPLQALARPSATGLTRRRIVAGALDAGQIALIADGVGLGLAALGYALALGHAGARMADGLPDLVRGGDAGPGAVALSLFHSGGLERAQQNLAHLANHDSGSFLIFFIAATAGALVWTLAHLLGAIAATVLHGAPYWHRRQGLVLVVERNGHFLGWGRSILRWTLLGLTLPLAAITALLGRTGLHDLLAGTRVHDRRS